MEEKKKGMSPILIVILTIIVICLVGFCTWYGVNYFKGEEKAAEQTSSVQPIEEPSSSQMVEEPSSNAIEEPPNIKINYPVGEKIDFPQKSDEDVILLNGFFEMITTKEVRTNFRNLKKGKNGNTLVYNCEEYDNEAQICQSFSILINNEITLNYFGDAWEKNTVNDETLLSEYLEYVEGIVYKIDNYYVFYEYTDDGLDSNKITIYNKSNKVYSIDNVKSEYWLGKPGADGYRVNVIPVVINKVLHFIAQGDIHNYKLKYNTIDLSKDKIEVKLLKEFTGYYVGGY